MDLRPPPIHRHPVRILTADFLFIGLLETVGPADTYINDPSRDSLSLHEAQVYPVRPGTPLASMQRPYVVVLRSNIILMYFDDADTRRSISMLTRKELLVSYTPVAVCRGYFHMPAEAKLGDFLGVVPTILLPVTETSIFPLVDMHGKFPTQSDLVLMGKQYINFYHTA